MANDAGPQRVSRRTEALGRAGVYGTLALALRHPDGVPDEAWAEALDALPEAVRATGGDPELVELAAEVQGGGFEREAAVRGWGDLMGHTPRAATTPYETEWTGAAGQLLQYHRIADVSAYYKAYGLDLAADSGERADHLAVELAFLSFLCSKEAYAFERGDEELRTAARDGQRGFLSDHLGRWAPAYAARLARRGGTSLYGRVGRLLEAWVAADCARLRVESGDPSLTPSPTSMQLEDTCISCAAAPACLGGEVPPPGADRGA